MMMVSRSKYKALETMTKAFAPRTQEAAREDSARKETMTAILAEPECEAVAMTTARTPAHVLVVASLEQAQAMLALERPREKSDLF